MGYYDSLNKLKSLDIESCKSISEEDGYLGFVACTEKTYQRSEVLLNEELSKYINKIKELNDNDVLESFYKYQREWLSYRQAKCDFMTSSATKGSDAYNSMHQLCFLTENYSYIKSLKSAPPPSS